MFDPSYVPDTVDYVIAHDKYVSATSAFSIRQEWKRYSEEIGLPIEFRTVSENRLLGPERISPYQSIIREEIRNCLSIAQPKPCEMDTALPSTFTRDSVVLFHGRMTDIISSIDNARRLLKATDARFIMTYDSVMDYSDISHALGHNLGELLPFDPSLQMSFSDASPMSYLSQILLAEPPFTNYFKKLADMRGKDV